jgi:Amt family ammonium transporter
MHYNSGDTAWLLISAALVLFMTPGVALFYGGMIRSKNVLSIVMQSLAAMAIITVLWIVFGFSESFSTSFSSLFGNLNFIGLEHLKTIPGFSHLDVPPLAFVSFQLMFAIITAALISGATAERLKFSSFCVFIAVWFVLVYGPIAHWSFSPEGWLAKRSLLDFAGGTVVEICSGFSALGLLLAVGPRRNWPKNLARPHSIPLSAIGAAIIWFGWFGFNAGSGIDANSVAAFAFINTQAAAAAGLIGWVFIERIKDSTSTVLGAFSGAVAGMVAITPCAGFVSPIPSLIIGLLAGVGCSMFVRTKFKFGLDDSLDVLGVHGIGGVIGTVLLGLFAESSVNSIAHNGLFFSGGLHQLGIQILATVVCAAYSCLISYLIGIAIKKTFGLRVDPEVEYQGLDLAMHGESAYGEDN